MAEKIAQRETNAWKEEREVRKEMGLGEKKRARMIDFKCYVQR